MREPASSLVRMRTCGLLVGVLLLFSCLNDPERSNELVFALDSTWVDCFDRVGIAILPAGLADSSPVWTGEFALRPGQTEIRVAKPAQARSDFRVEFTGLRDGKIVYHKLFSYAGGRLDYRPPLDLLPVKVSRISAKDLSLALGDSAEPAVEVEPVQATDKSYSLASGDSAVSISGTWVKAVRKGIASISLVARDDGARSTFSVTVGPPRLRAIEAEDLTGSVGDTLEARIILFPADAGDAMAVLKSDNPDRARVLGNRIICLDTGIAHINVTAGEVGLSTAFRVRIGPSRSASLLDLSLSSGNLTPPFQAATLAYSANVPHAVSSLTVTAWTGNGETIRVDGGVVVSGSASSSIALVVGENNITLRVTAQDGVTSKTYGVRVTRAADGNADLADLSLSAGVLAPRFQPGIPAYRVSVPHAIASLAVMPTVAGGKATIRVNGMYVGSGEASPPIPLSLGDNAVSIQVTAQDGVTVNGYMLTVSRAASDNANLSGMSLSAGILDPPFSGSIAGYACTVANVIASTTVTPNSADPGATVRVNGTAVASGTPSPPIPLAVGRNVILVSVRAQDGIASQAYTVVLTRLSANADLESLSFSAGPLNPAFASGVTGYTLEASYATAATTIIALPSDSLAGIRVNGAPVPPGLPSGAIPLLAGDNAVRVEVTAQDKTVKTYSVIVHREFDLNGSWSGLTSQGLPIRFAVANNTIASVGYDLNFSTTCVSGSLGSTTTFGTPVAIQDDIFAFVSPTLQLRSFSGSFATETSAGGNVRHTFADPICGTVTTTFSWTAGKVSGATVPTPQSMDPIQGVNDENISGPSGNPGGLGP